MHTNSLLAFMLEQPRLSSRCELVLDCIRSGGVMTDRQVKTALGFSDMNAVRPRVTELIQSGYLVECGNVKDEVTNMTVRQVRIA